MKIKRKRFRPKQLIGSGYPQDSHLKKYSTFYWCFIVGVLCFLVGYSLKF